MVMFIMGFLVGILSTLLISLHIGKKIEDKQLKQAEKLMRTFYKEELNEKEYEQFKTRYES